MYSLVRNLGAHRALYAEAPSLLASLIVAELFYKFHGFTLECAAFLGTWFVLSWVLARAAAAARACRLLYSLPCATP